MAPANEGTRRGGEKRGGLTAALLAWAWLGAATSARARPARAEVVVDVCRFSRARAGFEEARRALRGADRLLTLRCGLRVLAGRFETLPVGPFDRVLPADQARRDAILAALTAPVRRRESGDLTLFLVEGTRDSRMSWADVAVVPPREQCGLPPRAALARFGGLFFTDLAWDAIRAHDAEPEFARRPWMEILPAHEIVHALTNIRHPTGLPPGSLMADGLGDMGTSIDPKLCGCMMESPYVRALPASSSPRASLPSHKESP